ncbi:transposase [Streptomyces decoyicus]|uniref:transposase n=1 Tax=Streptomyces decoyicus TaxID=249567 RepID=UPI00345C7998
MLVAGLVVPLNDAHWARIKPLLPDPAPRRGGRWRYHRQVIDAIAWRFTTGAPDAVPPDPRTPTQVTIGDAYNQQIYACPAAPEHPHTALVQ